MVVVGAGGPLSLLNRSLLLFLGGMGEHTTTQYNNGGLLPCLLLGGAEGLEERFIGIASPPSPSPDFALKKQKDGRGGASFRGMHSLKISLVFLPKMRPVLSRKLTRSKSCAQLPRNKRTANCSNCHGRGLCTKLGRKSNKNPRTIEVAFAGGVT